MSPRNGRDRPALSHEHIIRTALALIDRKGPDGWSMRGLGAELGVDPMAVYYYLPNKAAVFDGVVEAVYAEIDLDGLPETGTWREQVAGAMRRMRVVLRRHPNTVPVIATRPANTPSVLALGERALARLQRAGLAPRDSLVIFHNLRAFTVGHVLAELGTPAGAPPTDPSDGEATLAAHPHLARAISGGYHPDEQYESGLKAMLDGYERLLATGGHP